MASNRTPKWDPNRAKPKERFDFIANVWTHDSPLLSESDLDRTTWNMPECSSWIETPTPVVTFEQRILSKPWLIAVYLLVLLGIALGRFVLRLDSFALCAFTGIAGLPLLALVTLVALDPKNGYGRRARSVREDERDQEVCPIVLTIYQSGVVTGDDVGVAWFDGPSLYFSGVNCSFAIGRRDIHQDARWRLGSRTDPMLDHNQFLFLKSDTGLIGLHMQPAFEVAEMDYPEAGQRFVEHRKEFRPGPGGPEVSKYPPLSVSPELQQDPLPIRHQALLQTSVFLYFAMLAMLAGAPMLIGMSGSAMLALLVPALRPRRNPQLLALLRNSK